MKVPSVLLFLSGYFVLTLLIGLWARGRQDSTSFLTASRSLPLWVVVAAYLAANCGALEVIGMSAMAAQYGVQAFHFYWIGAIPAMIFLTLWMMPVYRRSGVESVPDYLEARYSPHVRLLNAVVSGLLMLMLAGISLYAIAQVLEVIVGWRFGTGVIVAALVVLAYVLTGGLRATIYNEVLQLLIMLVGLIPLAVRSLLLLRSGFPSGHPGLWVGVPVAQPAAQMDGVGIVFGLGFVLSFGYWCTDFVLMQRAFAARSDVDARQVPLWAGFGKLLFSFIVVLPGLAVQRLTGVGLSSHFDQALPICMSAVYGPILLCLGVTALCASLMSGLAANISAFAAIVTNDIYHAHLRKNVSDKHLVTMGRVLSGVAIMAGILTSYINFLFKDLMEHVQLLFSVFGAPFWAIFLLGMTTRRTTARGALAGFCAGTLFGLAHLVAIANGTLRYGSTMNADFHGAIYSFSAAIIVAFIASYHAEFQQSIPNSGLIIRVHTAFRGERIILLWVFSLLLLIACLWLNFRYRA